MRYQAHIFIDNSNLIGGAQRYGRQFEGAHWASVRMYWRNFFQLIESDYLPITRSFAGSLPPGNEELWEYARKYGYDTSLLHRVERDDGRIAEQAVDEVLHAKIAGALLDHEPPQVLVLVTGDGADSDYGTSFRQQVDRAVRRGWVVDIISWECQLSGKLKAVAAAHPNQVMIRTLEPLYRSITFLKEGTYRSEAGADVYVPRRIVAPLPA